MSRGLDDSSTRGSIQWLQIVDEEFRASCGPISFFDAIQRTALEALSHVWHDQVRSQAVCRRLVIPGRWKERFDGISLIALVNKCTSHTEFDVAHCSKLIDEAIETIAAGCAALTSLGVSICENLTSEAIEAVAVGCASLTSLDIWSCSKLTNEATKAAAVGCAVLTSLNVGGCSKLTDDAIEDIAAGCAALTSPDVASCSELTDDAIQVDAATCAALTSFDVSYCETSPTRRSMSPRSAARRSPRSTSATVKPSPMRRSMP